MRIILWSILACSAMRYNACAAVTIGDDCTEEEEGMLEATKKPNSTVDDDCYETLAEAHEIAQCTEQNGSYTWTYYASCTGGLKAVTNGTDFECQQSIIYDCDNTIFPEEED